MNFAPYLRLVWKEYRAIRLFWLSLVGIIVLVQLLVVAVSQEKTTTISIVYNLMLVAPAMFALGCAGTTFAVEHEDGTFDFLRIIPTTAAQILTSKFLLVFVATIAAYFVLGPLALLLTHSQMPDPAKLHGLCGLWITAALEAIAWGILFSLLTARPLVAICLAMVAGSTVAHVLSWHFARTSASFELDAYDKAVPLRAAVALIVLGFDIVLGLRWLNPGTVLGEQRSATAKYQKSKSLPSAAAADHTSTIVLTAQPDRASMLGHLLWQHWRQARWLMLSMTVMLVVIPPILSLQIFRWGYGFSLTAMSVLAALMGCFVFLPDQERRGYRFFVEHNVPARYAWFTRHLLWLITLTIAVLLLIPLWIGTSYVRLWDVARLATDPQRQELLHDIPRMQLIWYELSALPPLAIGLGCIAVSYAAGQWASMHIRSGIMSGFCGLLLAGALSGWVTLMNTMQVPWIWSVVTIPVVLLFATWLRAPDWIRENSCWRARIQTAAAVLVPGCALLVVVPIYRVHQIPLVDPYYPPPVRSIGGNKFEEIYLPFNLETYLPPITSEALATGDIYRKANDLYVPLAERRSDSPDSDLPTPESPADKISRAPTQNELNWLHENSQTLALLLAASRRPSCALADPHTMTMWATLKNQEALVHLLIFDARRLEAEGKLDEALDRYFEVFQTAAHLSDHQPFDSLGWGAHTVGGTLSAVLTELPYWAAQKGQTVDRILAAMERLNQLEVLHIVHLKDGLRANYLIARRFLMGDESLRYMFFEWQSAAQSLQTDLYREYRERQIADQTLWAKLLPWENSRALRLLNQLTATALHRLFEMGLVYYGESSVADYLTPFSMSRSMRITNFFIAGDIRYRGNQLEMLDRFDDFNTTSPDLFAIGMAGEQAAKSYAGLETYKRATMLILALQAYKLDHGELATCLDDLQGKYIETLPIDPYTGGQFIYFQKGIPAPTTPLEDAELHESGHYSPIVPGVPCLWSAGPDLVTHRLEIDGVDFVYYHPREYGREYWGHWPQFAAATYFAWAQGVWYPIPVTHK